MKTNEELRDLLMEYQEDYSDAVNAYYELELEITELDDLIQAIKEQIEESGEEI